MGRLFFFQAGDGIRDGRVTEFRRVLFRSPDGDFLLGESAEVRGFYIAGGTPGIAAGGGVGKAMAEWIIEGRPSLDLWRADKIGRASCRERVWSTEGADCVERRQRRRARQR